MAALLPESSQSEPSTEPSSRRRRRVNWLRIAIVGTVGGLLIIGGLAALGSAAKGLNAGQAFGVPQDFPIYPGANLLGVNENFSTGATLVRASWDANASLDTVTAFYSSSLNQPPWTVTKMDPASGTWEFRRSDGKMDGLIQLSGHGQRTRIDVNLRK